MKNAAIDKEKAFLNSKDNKRPYIITRYFPSKDLQNFVHHYWIARWDLREQKPYVQNLLPHPSINIVIEKNNSQIIGVINKKASQTLRDEGLVFAAMFQPGGFYPFVKIPLVNFTDKKFTIEEICHHDSKLLEETILKQKDEKKMVALFEEFLRDRFPKTDLNIEKINTIIDSIIANRTICKVDDLVNQFGLSKRTLQRLFNQYVGVSPKWVIRLYRLQEATQALAAGENTKLTQVALDLGYFDRTHFMKDFKAIIGKSPQEYRKNREQVS